MSYLLLILKVNSCEFSNMGATLYLEPRDWAQHKLIWYCDVDQILIIGDCNAHVKISYLRSWHSTNWTSYVIYTKSRYWNILSFGFYLSSVKHQRTVRSVLLHKKVSIKYLAIIVVWSGVAGKTGLTSHFSSVAFFCQTKLLIQYYTLSRQVTL